MYEPVLSEYLHTPGDKKSFKKVDLFNYSTNYVICLNFKERPFMRQNIHFYLIFVSSKLQMASLGEAILWQELKDYSVGWCNNLQL